ncbi:MAG: hypothetical protein QOF66_2899, partial [Mycobacterium sp.]|nr:hypothetical protein [Mycobacterium sp.]
MNAGEQRKAVTFSVLPKGAEAQHTKWFPLLA